MDKKAISWFRDIYQKIEAVCLEAEEAMYQGPFRYVGDEVLAVGSNVKRFCSDIILDLHPQSNIDHVEIAAADLSLNPNAYTEIDKNLKADLKGYPPGIRKGLIDDAQGIKGKSKNGGIYRLQNVGSKKSSRDRYPPSKKSDAFDLVSVNEVECSSNSKGYDLEEAAKETDNHIMNTSVPAVVEAAKETDNHIMNTSVPAVGDLINTNAPNILSAESVNRNQADLRNTTTSPGRHTEQGGEAGSGITERSEKLSSAMPPMEHILIESDVEIVEHFSESELKGTCVMVEGDKLCVPQLPVEQKSYKKLLRRVFSMKSSTRTEYEQLGALHDQQPDLETEEKAVQALTTSSDSKNLAANDLSESEWELL